jgi:hypothetical protein
VTSDLPQLPPTFDLSPNEVSTVVIDSMRP